MTNLDSILKNRDIILPTKVHIVKAMVFTKSGTDVRVGSQIRLSAKEVMLSTVVLENTLESPWDKKAIKPVNPKGNQPRTYTERTDAEAEASILWPPDAKS